MTRRFRARRLAWVALLAVAIPACSLPEARNPFAQARRGRDERIQVMVQNHNYLDATIHAVRGAERMRLGEVTGKSDKAFTVRWRLTLPIEFQIHLIGGGGCTVQATSVNPGDRIWVRIPPDVSATLCDYWKS